jgi:inhibitor of cysteine peptidase
MKRLFTFVILGLIMTIVLTACSGKNIKINADSNGQTISMNTGDTLTVSIEGNPTTGYTWELSEVDQAILKSAGDPDFKSSSTLVGAGGTYTFKFDAIAAGTTTMKLKYWRSFEKDTPPINTFEVTVIVK